MRLICDLQSSEREKLNVTAALHLERIREKNETGEGSGDDRIHNLLRDGVASLRDQVTDLIERINDALEELRYAMAEEE